MSTTRKILSTLTIVAVTTTAGLSVISNAQAHYSPWLHSHVLETPGLVGPGPATVEPTPVPGAVGPAPEVRLPEVEREERPRRRNRRSWAIPK